MLDALGVTDVCLLSNNLVGKTITRIWNKCRGTSIAGLVENIDCLQAKADRMGHDINLED